MHYTFVRLYSDPTGESHFADVEIDLTLTDYAPPAPPLELSTTTPAKQFGFMNAPAGWSSDWHPSSERNIFFVLTGEWEVTASDGETRRFAAGSAPDCSRSSAADIRKSSTAAGERPGRNATAS